MLRQAICAIREGPMKPTQNVTIGKATVDFTMIFPLKGAGEVHLRNIYMEICRQIHINEENMKEFKAFEFEFGYKYGIPTYIQELFLLNKYGELLRLSLS